MRFSPLFGRARSATRPRSSARVVALLLVSLLALAGLGAPIGAAGLRPEAERANPAITWRVDHPAKTITVSVNLAVFVDPFPDNDVAFAAMQSAAARIEADIRRVWSNLRFKCYAFIVDPHVRLVGGEGAVRNDEMGIRLDTSVLPAGTHLFRSGRTGSEPMRSYVAWESGQEGEVTSDQPHNGSIPTGPHAEYRSVWAFMERPNVYAHEFGHILGLQDFYGADGRQRPGTAFDLMFYQTLPVSPETVTQVIRRSGQVDESTIRCPISIDLPPFSFGVQAAIPGTAGGTVSFHAWACDYDPPTMDSSRRRPITVKVAYTGHGGANAGPFGEESGGGTVDLDSTIPPPFGSVETGTPSRFTFQASPEASISTPMRFGTTGLLPAGPTVATIQGVTLDMGTVAVTDGAAECR